MATRFIYHQNPDLRRTIELISLHSPRWSTPRWDLGNCRVHEHYVRHIIEVGGLMREQGDGCVPFFGFLSSIFA